MTTRKFEDTGLPANPVIEKAFALRSSFIADGTLAGEQEKMTLDLAKTLNSTAIADPHLIAAALVLPVYLNHAYDNPMIASRLQAGLEKTSLYYLDAHLRALHPFEVSESFQMLPIEHRHAAAALITATHLSLVKELPLGRMSAKDIRQAAQEIFKGGDPVMPSLEDYMIMGDVAKRSPNLWAEAARAYLNLETVATSKDIVASRKPPGPRR